MNVYPPEAYPPKNWATLKKEPLSFIKAILLGAGIVIAGIVFTIAIALIGITLFELSTVLIYEWAH